jgi:Holliday junction DNA helicase RuvA
VYEHLTGQLVRKGATDAVLDVGGVGWRLEISLSTSARLPAEGRVCTVLVHHRLQEDKARLFGFADEDERALFRTLINVPGIGPGTALTLLSAHTAAELLELIARGAVKELAKARGVGPKTAQRVVAELAGHATRHPTASMGQRAQLSSDAVAALVVLGCPSDKAEGAVTRALAELPPDTPIAELVRRALKLL